MSNLSDDTLRKILTQIQTQAIASQRALTSVRAQVQSKEKERKILQLTMRELGAVPREEGVYKSVGKMYVSLLPDSPRGRSYRIGDMREEERQRGAYGRFVAQSRKDIDAEQSAQEKALSEEITNLTKKAKYLEKQFDEANSQLKDIFHSQRRQQEA